MEPFENEIPARKEGKVCGVYVIHHGDKAYIGSTANLYDRACRHKTHLNAGSHPNQHLQEAFDATRTLAFSCQPTSTIEEARRLEQDLISRHHDTGVLFNIATDVEAPQRGLTRSSEIRENLSSIKRGVPRPADVAERIRTSNQEHGVKVSINGEVYPGVRAAARAFDVSPACVRNRIESESEKFKDWVKV